MFGLVRTLFFIFVNGIVVHDFRTFGGENTTYFTTDYFSLTTVERHPEGSFECTGSETIYDLEYICDGIDVCLHNAEDFHCGDEVFIHRNLAVRCFNTSSTFVQVIKSCNQRPDCKDDNTGIFCDSATCGSTCTFCPDNSMPCDLKEAINGPERVHPTSTIQHLKLVNFSDLQYGLPMTQSKFPFLTRLDLSRNRISSLHIGSFKNMPGLHRLNLTGNLLTSIEQSAFSGLRELRHLDIGSNNIQQIQTGIFEDLPSLETLILRNNSITTIESGGFRGLVKITGLSLTENKLTNLRSGMMEGLSSLKWISFRKNKLVELRRQTLDELFGVTWLSFARNSLSYVEPGTFDNMTNLKYLYLEWNEITFIQRELLVNLRNLLYLELDGNSIHTINTGTFQDLDSIKTLILRNNSISTINPGAFRGLDKINGISFTDNRITELRGGMLDGLSSVRWLSLRRNPLAYIAAGTFDNMTEIRYLLLQEVQLENLEHNMFRGIRNIKSLSTDDYRLCCLFDDSKVCTIANRSALDSCDRLMPNAVLRVAMWVLGFGALLGNTMVIIIRWRSRKSKDSKHQQPFFISNLAVADWLMGVFMVIIASADIYHGEYYFLKAPQWRNSSLCKVAGAIAILSSESSVFLLTIITLDRFLSIMFPFSPFKFRTMSARVCIATMWVITLILSLGPIVIGSFVHGFYGLSDVCIGLPLSVDSTSTGSLVYDHTQGITVFIPNNDGTLQPSWVYSIALFLGINLLCFLFILICYIAIFIKVKRSSTSIGKDRNNDTMRDQEVKIALKMAIIVGTDFCCWMPVIIMGIISQSGAVTLPVSLYAWSAVFILPINASLNPYLYTFTEFIGKRRKNVDNQTSLKTGSTTTGSKSSIIDTKF